MRHTFFLTGALALACAAGGTAQPRTRPDCPDSWNSRRATYCEEREETFAGGSPLDIDAGRNGGVRVRGWDRSSVLIRARIVAHADTESDARRLADGVRIETAAGNVSATGPDTRGDEHWAVSFDLQVPRDAQLTMNANNGGISITDFRGRALFRARNGGISLTNIGGDIRGETTNGGLSIELTGDRWEGAGLDVETRNGGVRMTMPDRYSAELETGTVNGRVNIGFPIMVRGTIGRHITTTLGSGGPRIRAMTTNGGVTILRR